MRWYSKPRPKYGDIRVKCKFLLFPKWIDGEWRWFERAAWIEKYDRYELDIECMIWYLAWQEQYWMDKNRVHTPRSRIGSAFFGHLIWDDEHLEWYLKVTPDEDQPLDDDWIWDPVNSCWWKPISDKEANRCEM